MNMKRIWMLAALCATVATAGNAWAHAHPKSMVPGADATVAAPAEVSITFTEALEQAFSSLTVRDAAGHAVANGKAEVAGATHTVMRLAVPALAPGVYTVQWVAVARDGHRTNGSYSFTVK
jgi:methionine-rich copper-binding protein CopC